MISGKLLPLPLFKQLDKFFKLKPTKLEHGLEKVFKTSGPVFLKDSNGYNFDPYLENLRSRHLKLHLHQQIKPQKPLQQPIPTRPPPQSPSSVTRHRIPSHPITRGFTVTTSRNNTDVILQQRQQLQEAATI